MPLSSHSLKPGDLELDLKATFTDRSPGGSPKPPASPISPSPRPSAGPSVAASGLLGAVKEYVPEIAHLTLPHTVASQWQLRLSTESQLAAKGKNAGQEFPVTWYGRALLELCGPCAMELAPQLNELEAHQRSCPYMWKEGGHLPAMLEQCCMMLAKASQVAEAVSIALTSSEPLAESVLVTTLRTVRAKCFRANYQEPSIQACLECGTPEEAVAIAQVALALLQGSGAALGTALRTAPGAALVRGALEEQLWEDFTCLVPFLEMTLSKLRTLADLVLQQLEEDLALEPIDIDFEGSGHSASALEPSPSIAAFWAGDDLTGSASLSPASPTSPAASGSFAPWSEGEDPSERRDSGASEGGAGGTRAPRKKGGKKKTMSKSTKSRGAARSASGLLVDLLVGRNTKTTAQSSQTFCV